MYMYPDIFSGPSVEPLSLTEVKKHLRLIVDDSEVYTEEDDNLTSLITEAREYVEQHTMRALISQIWDVALYEFPLGNFIELPFGSLQSVESVSYTDSNGNSANFTEFEADTFLNGVKLVYGYNWPSIYPESRITIRFTCGYGDAASNVPKPIIRAMLLLIGDWHKNREATTVTNGRIVSSRIKPGVEALLAPYRIYTF